VRRALGPGTAVVGLILVVAGGVTYRRGDDLPRGYVTYGASYQPLAVGTSTRVVSWTAAQLVGAGLGVLGLLLLAGLGGRWLGRRAGRSRLLPWSAAAIGALLIGAGAVAFGIAAGRPVVGGWVVGYAPLSTPATTAYSSRLELSYDHEVLQWSGLHLLGALLAVAGLVVLAAVGGWSTARWRAR